MAARTGRRTDEVHDLLVGSGLTPTSTHGIRVFTDLVPSTLLDLEQLTEADLERLRSRYESLGQTAREDLLRGMADTDTPDVPVETQHATKD